VLLLRPAAVNSGASAVGYLFGIIPEKDGFVRCPDEGLGLNCSASHVSAWLVLGRAICAMRVDMRRWSCSARTGATPLSLRAVGYRELAAHLTSAHPAPSTPTTWPLLPSPKSTSLISEEVAAIIRHSFAGADVEALSTAIARGCPCGDHGIQRGIGGDALCMCDTVEAYAAWWTLDGRRSVSVGAGGPGACRPRPGVLTRLSKVWLVLFWQG
jgi:hypothetical protein